MSSRILRVALLLAMTATSCARLPQPTSEQATAETNSRRDSTGTSTVYRETVRLTPVEAAADAVDFQTQLEVLPTGKLKPATYNSRGRRATAKLKVDEHGKLTGQCGCDAERATITSLDRELSQARHQVQQKASTKYVTTRITRTVRVPYTAWYDWLARFVAVGLLLILLVLFIIHRFTRRTDE